MDFIRVSLVTICMMLSQWVPAGTVPNLYRAEINVPVQQQGAPSQAQLQTALINVLVKVSGQANPAANTLINQQLPLAESMMQQFSYTNPADVNATDARLLIDFNRQSVDNLIMQAGFKPIGDQRPTVLIWAVTDQKGDQAFLTQESNVIGLLQAQAEQRGIPLQLPLLDLTDQVSLPVSDLWGLFPEPVMLASQRYRPDAVIAARFKYSPSGVLTMDWLYFDGAEPVKSTSSGAEAVMAEELITRLADTLFKPVVYHRLSDFQTGLAIHIDNVSSLADYDAAVNFLDALPIVSKVKPERVQGDRMTVRVELEGSSAQLVDAISIEPRMQPLDLSAADEQLRYYWQP